LDSGQNLLMCVRPIVEDNLDERTAQVMSTPPRMDTAASPIGVEGEDRSFVVAGRQSTNQARCVKRRRLQTALRML
jgi:hypothetical protein